MKKFSLILAIVSVMSLVLVGCSGGAKEEGGATDTKTETPAAETK